MSTRKEPLFSIKIDRNPGGMSKNLRRLEITIGGREIAIEFGVSYIHWHYCKKCGSIVEKYGCSNFLCATHFEKSPDADDHTK